MGQILNQTPDVVGLSSLVQTDDHNGDGFPDDISDPPDGISDVRWCLQSNGTNDIIFINDFGIITEIQECAKGVSARAESVALTRRAILGGVVQEADIVVFDDPGNTEVRIPSDGTDTDELPWVQSSPHSALHEWGHFLGLLHEDDMPAPYCSLMIPFVPNCGNPGFGGAPTGTPLSWANASLVVNTDDLFGAQSFYYDIADLGQDFQLYKFERLNEDGDPSTSVASREVWTPATATDPRIVRKLNQKVGVVQPTEEDWLACPGDYAGELVDDVTLPPAPIYASLLHDDFTAIEDVTVHWRLVQGTSATVGDCQNSPYEIGTLDVSLTVGIPLQVQLLKPGTTKEQWCIPTSVPVGDYTVCAYLELPTGHTDSSPGNHEVYSDHVFKVRECYNVNNPDSACQPCDTCECCNSNPPLASCEPGVNVNWPIFPVCVP